MDGITDHDQRTSGIKEKLLQLAARRGSPEMSIWIEGFVNWALRRTGGGAVINELNPRAIMCIENEWRDLVAPTLAPPVVNAARQLEMFE